MEFNDVGDVDVIIFFNLDDLMINDELIEYLFNNLGYVRIKGVDYFLLQFCFVEGIEYVVSLVLRNFYLVIYGELVFYIYDFIISVI